MGECRFPWLGLGHLSRDDRLGDKVKQTSEVSLWQMDFLPRLAKHGPGDFCSDGPLVSPRSGSRLLTLSLRPHFMVEQLPEKPAEP